jgi:hypothetical protein
MLHEFHLETGQCRSSAVTEVGMPDVLVVVVGSLVKTGSVLVLVLEVH